MTSPSNPSSGFTKEDFKIFKSKSLTESDIKEQLEKYRTGLPYANLIEPLTPDNGIHLLTGPDCEIYAEAYDSFTARGSVAKFVPGSFGRNKIFRPLTYLNNSHDQIDKRMLTLDDPYTEKNLSWFQTFIENLEKFAFAKDLSAVLEHKKLNLKNLLAKGEYKEILKGILDGDGLNYSELPKGLLKIHEYPEFGTVTPIEEHIIQEVEYLLHQKGKLKVHFTASNRFYPLFRDHIKDIKKKYNQPGIHLLLEVSIQDPLTDTLSVDFENKPFRIESGELMFSPGGHGTLLKNLASVDSDLVFLKNMNDVCHESNKQTSLYFQKVLGGYLLEIRKKIFVFLNKLEEAKSPSLLLDIERYCKAIFSRDLRAFAKTAKRTSDYKKLLNRPIRVCGMVPKENYKGGWPFRVRSRTGEKSIQIIEKNQIDFSKNDQQEIYHNSTYFNPVHIVCSFVDYQGNPFNLEDFSDRGAYQINIRHYQGEPVKSLELPGLWNGSMYDWNTAFVEIPKETYFPITHLMDLKSSDHF